MATLKYGNNSDGSAAAAHGNFVKPKINPLSLCTTPIELLSNDGSNKVLSTATGFFWKSEGKSFLVTNYHVVSGRDGLSGKLNDDGFIPTKFSFYGTSISIENGLVKLSRPKWNKELDKATLVKLETPPEVGGVPVDVWAHPVPESIVFDRDEKRIGFDGSQKASCFINEAIGEPIYTEIGSECFILGYPLSNYDGLMPPIWKRGSIASEPLIGIDGKPIFLVDASTSSGMSGAPIIRRSVGFTAKNNDMGAIQEMTSYDFVGIYGGRLLNSKLNEMNIGYGWYKSLISDVIEFYGYK